jgi:sigma-70-like protein
MTAMNTRLNASLCVASAFLPLLITVWGIHADIELTEWRMLFNPINLTAFLWLGLTVLNYRHARTKSAAWLFALFPIAFAEPVPACGFRSDFPRNKFTEYGAYWGLHVRSVYRDLPPLPTRRLSMRKTKEVLRLRYELGLGQRAIARACSISQGAVHNYLKKATAAGIHRPLPEG